MYDLLFRGIQVLDGTGGVPFIADVAVESGRLAWVGPRRGAHATRELEGDGLALAPGFIDLHSHADLTLPAFPEARNSIQQGVTTEVVGNCGFSPAPVVPAHAAELRRLVEGLGPDLDWSWATFGEYLDVLDRRRPPVNVVALVGHGALRLAATGFEDRAARPDEIDVMGRLLRQALAEGAWGFSTGLDYPPGTFARTAELVALGRVLAGQPACYFTHVRSAAATWREALVEATAVGVASGGPVHVSHLNSSAAVWGGAGDAVRVLEETCAQPLRIYADAYPYTAGSTYLSQLLPPWTFEGGAEALLARLRSPEARRRIQGEIERGDKGASGARVDFGQVLLTALVREHNQRWEGVSLAEAARIAGQPGHDFLFDLLIDEDAGTVMVQFSMEEDDVRHALRWPHTAIGSDQLGVVTDSARVHPRAYGTFARVLGRYARDESLFSVSEAVRRMTGLPATIVGLQDRGLIEEGLVADLVVFDPARVTDRATYRDPTLPPVGIRYVVVNGQIVVEAGQVTGRAGRVLRPAWAA